MTTNQSEIEKRLQALVETSMNPQQPTFWNSKLFKLLTFLTFFLVAACGAFCLFEWIQYRGTDTDLVTYKDLIKKNTAKLVEANENVKVFTHELEALKEALTKAQNSVKDYKNKTAEWEKKIGILEADIATMKKHLEETIKERDDLKKTHDALKVENDRLKKEWDSKKAEAHTQNNTLNLKERQLAEWKIGAGAGFLATILGALDAVATHVNVWKETEHLALVKQYQAAFPALSPGFENYTIISHIYGKEVHSKSMCYRWGVDHDFSKCINLSPSVTTITTTSGFKFGVVLSIPWKTTPGAYADDQAFAFSANHAHKAPIIDKANAFIVSPNSLFQFGKTDINISLDGSHGTARGDSYNIPPPFDKEHFFHNGASFHVSDIRVEIVTFAP